MKMYSTMTVIQLKDELRKRKASVSGKKAALIDRSVQIRTINICRLYCYDFFMSANKLVVVTDWKHTTVISISV